MVIVPVLEIAPPYEAALDSAILLTKSESIIFPIVPVFLIAPPYEPFPLVFLT